MSEGFSLNVNGITPQPPKSTVEGKIEEISTKYADMPSRQLDLAIELRYLVLLAKEEK